MFNSFEIENTKLIKYTGSESHVIIPECVTEIGEHAFDGCTSMGSVVIPENVWDIGSFAFRGCTNLTSVTIPDMVMEIGGYAFKGCTSLTSVTMLYTPTIRTGAFEGCTSLTSVFFQDGSMLLTGEGVFDGCPKVTIICREGSNTQEYCLKEKLNYLFDYQFEAFHGVIPPGIERLAAPFLADEEKPYIFISYSHKNRDVVLQIIKTLYESGWKIWYDEGLTIGDRYDITLESHVKNCAAFLLFITEQSVDSHYVLDNEIPWAIEAKRPIIKCIIDEGTDLKIEGGTAFATVSPLEIEPALEKVDGLRKGERREAKGISVVVNPEDREKKSGDGFAYCLYFDDKTELVKAIMLEARNSGCVLYDAVQNGEDTEKLQNSASLIIFLDQEFLSDKRLTDILIREFKAGKDMAICQLEKIRDDDLPQELAELHYMQWLNYSHGINSDLNTKLARHLQKRGCRNTSILPGFEYEKTKKGIVIKRYTGKDPVPQLEREYGGTPVVEITDNAFRNCINLKEFEIPDSVESIGNGSFAGCTNLSSIIIPESVREIGNSAFLECIHLTSVAIPRSVTKIENSVFADCVDLTSVKIPNSVSEIGMQAFKGCKKLTSIELPEGVNEIKGAAFYGCAKLISITIPESVTEIDSTAFLGCLDLTVTCPHGSYAWRFCRNFPIPVGDGGTSDALEGTMYASERTMITDPNYEIVGSKLICYAGINRETAVIPEGVTEICAGAFRNCKELRNVVIPEGVTVIGDSAFCGCENLERITIPDSVREIGVGAFRDCWVLESVEIPDSVIKIGCDAFRNCERLYTVMRPQR